jgi:hypothetical protein
MNSKNLVRLVVIGIILLICDCVLCLAIFLPMRSRVAPTPVVQQWPTATVTLRPTATVTLRPTTTPVPATQPTRSTTTPPTATTARPPASPTPGLITSIAGLEQAISAGRHGAPFSIAFTEQQIRDEIALYLSSTGDVTFSDVTVTLQPGVALITGKVRVLGFNVSAKATTTVVLVDGRPRLKVLKLDALGGLLPGAVKDKLIEIIEQQSDLPLLADLPVTIQSVEIQTGQAVVTGVTN